MRSLPNSPHVEDASQYGVQRHLRLTHTSDLHGVAAELNRRLTGQKDYGRHHVYIGTLPLHK